MTGPDRRGALVQAALRYAALGWHVYPADNNKKPLIKGWNGRAATDDPLRIEALFGEFPEANLGIATGPSGLVAIDVDPQNGGELSWRKLCSRIGLEVFENAPTSRTPHGGLHVYLGAPTGREIRSCSNALGKGIDIKAAGGGVLAPPSVVGAGEYSWYNPPHGLLPELPVAIRDIIAQYRPALKGSHVGEVRLHERNNTLARIAGRLRRFGHSEIEILATLQAVNLGRCHPPLGDKEVQATAHSIALRDSSPDPSQWLQSWLKQLSGNLLRLAVFYAGMAERAVPQITPSQEFVCMQTGLCESRYRQARIDLERLGAIYVVHRGKNASEIVMIEPSKAD